MTDMPKLCAAAIAALLVSGGARADGEAWHLEVAVPLDYIGGHTTYDIAASDGQSSIRSQLVFPLQGVMTGLRVSARSPWDPEDRTRWLVEATGLHTLTDMTGTMKDSDWLDGPVETAPRPDGMGLAPHPGKDIFSTSKAFLSAMVLDGRIGLEHAAGTGFVVGPLWGALYQDFYYAVVDVNQVGYGSYAPGFTADIGGRGLTYGVKWLAPYMGARAEYHGSGVGATLEGWFSPLAMGWDRDDHELRQKLSETSARGHAWQVRADGRWFFTARNAIALQGSVVGFSASGKQVQTDYSPGGGSMGGIRSELTSLRWSAGVAYLFRY